VKVEQWNEATDGPFSEAALRRKLQRLGYEVSRDVYPPGTYFPDHSHGIDKMDAVVSGRFRMVVEGRELILEAGDALAVPRGIVHSAEVVGEEPVVSLDGTKP
jgi:quercetin dioxygenase-like cupin family protein